jgi:hypothetical protein
MKGNKQLKDNYNSEMCDGSGEASYIKLDMKYEMKRAR